MNADELPPHAGPGEAPDWTRESVRPGEWAPGKALLKAIRDYQRAGGPLRRKWCVLRFRFWSAVAGADIPLNCRLGGGLLLPHPNGIVIHPQARIGANCLLFQQVTIGGGGKHPGLPTIHDHVDIGAGAKVLGGVVVGGGARIGANAVVVDHVPPGRTAVGIPARLLPERP